MCERGYAITITEYGKDPKDEVMKDVRLDYCKMHSKAQLNRQTTHEPNALKTDSAHEKFDV